LAMFPKPIAGFDEGAARALAETIRRLVHEVARKPSATAETSVEIRRPVVGSSVRTAHAVPLTIVGIVGSTGALAALRTILTELPTTFSLPVVVVQHTERGYAQHSCSWLAESSSLPVHLGRDGHVLLPGEVVVAPDDVHMEIGTGGIVALRAGPAVDGFRPSATVLLASLAASFGNRSMGVVLSGMGSDGAAGLRAIAAAGGVAIVEDPHSAVVPGMPRRALEETPRAQVQPSASFASLLIQLAEAGASRR
jgi:two-component system, chemotaxis family, protein-glutamate methylesterase/glutaminase